MDVWLISIVLFHAQISWLFIRDVSANQMFIWFNFSHCDHVSITTRKEKRIREKHSGRKKRLNNLESKAIYFLSGPS